MAKKHRRLFPLLSQTNQTIDCSTGYCDPACPYNCYSDPDYNTLSPLSPPLPPPPQTPEPISVVGQGNRGINISSNVILVAAAASVVCFLILVGFYLIAKFASHRRNVINRLQDGNVGQEEGFLDEGQVDHPIWFIRTVGLHQSVINSITVCRYRRGEGLIEGTDCPVCLNEFQEHETLRLLPKCNHAFHISCIDTWLLSHINCPLCRAHIVFDSASNNHTMLNEGNPGDRTNRMEDSDEDGENRERNNSADQGETGVQQERDGEERGFKEAVNPNNDHSICSDQNTNTQMESFDLSRESDQNQVRKDVQSENRCATESESEDDAFEKAVNFNDGSLLDLSSGLNSNTQMESIDLSGESSQNEDRKSGDRSRNSSAEAERVADKKLVQEATYSNGNCFNDQEPAETSFSMDFDGSSNSCSCEIEEISVLDARKSHPAIFHDRLKLTGSSSISRFLRKSPVSMKRSASCKRF